ncbi:MAG TPA: hypothetical protein VGB24_06220 [Longimicrobium sp.]|jgi:hypothetical protein
MRAVPGSYNVVTMVRIPLASRAGRAFPPVRDTDGWRTGAAQV